MRPIAWAFPSLALLAIACGPTGQTEVKPPPDVQAKIAEGGDATQAKQGARAKSASTDDTTPNKMQN